MFEKITSLTNPKIKNIVRLRERKARDEQSFTIIDGAKETVLALQAGIEIVEIYFSESHENKFLNKEIHTGFLDKVKLIETSADVYEKISYGDRNDGVLSIAKTRSFEFADLKTEGDVLYVVIESVEKPGNLGAILRSCDGVGVNGVLICEEGTDVYNPNVIRASLGTLFSLKIVTTSNDKALEFLKKNNVHVITTSPQSEEDYSKIKANQPLAIVVGSEAKGLSPFWLEHCDQSVSLPMKGKVDSLNVSATTAVILYEINRQKD